MSHLRRFSSCLVVAGCLIPAVVWGAPPVERADRADREQKVVELFARGGDATALREEIAREGAVRRAPLRLESRETADLRGALETMARQSRGITARRAALTEQELTGLLAAYDRLRAADLSLRARFRSAGERIASRKFAGGAAGRLAEAEAAYTAAAERILKPLSAPAEAARKAWQDKKPLAAATTDLARAFEAVRPALSAATEPVAHPILRASELPYRRTGLAPRAPVTAPAVQPSYLDPTGAQPTGADRSGTTQAPLTPEILAKAAELGHDYTRIYQFVRNNIRTEWYAGGMKGAAGTLLQGSGNDVDQASLLIALLRASDAPARYVHGVVELPVDAVAESLGVPAASVPAALARAGVALTPIVHGGKVAAVQVEQTWVSAYVPYTNYRGAVVDFSGKTWVPLAPARKGVADVLPTGILRRMAYSVDGAIASTIAAPQAEDPLAAVRRDVEAWLARNASGETWDGQLGSRSIKPEDLELLPSSLPMTVVAVTGEEADLAAAQTHSLHLLVRSGDAADAPVILDLTLPLAAVASHRLTLSYLPATVDDQATIDAFGGLSLVPPYLVKLRPEIRLDGRAVAVGTGAVDMAATHTFELLVDGPFGEERIDETVIAGGYYALGVSAQQARHHMASADEVLDPADDEYLAARLLSQIALGYSERWDQGEATLAGLLSVSVVRPLPTVAVAGTAVTVESAFGLPQSLRFDGVTLDASLRVAEPLARTADTAAPRDWMRLSALEGSALEHFVFEQDFLVDSISADKGLGVAHQAGMDVLHVDAQNAATVVPTLQQPDAVKQEIQDWVRQGMTVDVPRSAVMRADWQGSVWRVEDPVSGGGGYFIAGGLAGGATAVTPDAWVLGFLANVLRSPYSTGPNTNPLAGVLLRKIAGSDGGFGQVGQLGPFPEVIVTDVDGRPVQGARVTFTSIQGGGHLIDELHHELDSLTVRTDFRGIASVPLKLGQHTADNPVYVRLAAGEANSTQALEHLIDVTAESFLGTLTVDTPFQELGYPGPVTELKRTDRDGTVFNAIVGIGMWADTLSIQARDRFGNPVSNVDLTFLVGPLGAHDETCENQPHFPQNAAVFDPAVDAAGKLINCPNQHPLLGECGGQELTVKTGHSGASAGLILGNSANYVYTVDVTASGLPAGSVLSALHFSYSGLVIANGSTHHCDANALYFARMVSANELGDEIAATRAGHALAQPVDVGLLYWRPAFTVESRPKVNPDGSVGKEYYKRDLMDGQWERITGRVVFQVGNGGQASPAVLTNDLTYRTTVTTGPIPGANAVTLHADELLVAVDDVNPNTGDVSNLTEVLPSNLFSIDGKVLDVWGLDPKIVAVAPSPIPLTTTGRSATVVALEYTVEPPGYFSNTTEIDLFGSGLAQGTAIGSTRSGAGLASIQRGFPFSAGTVYEAELVLNRGTQFEVHGDRFPLPLHAGIFSNIHGQGSHLSDVTGAIHLSQDVDLVNQRYCATGGNFHFDLAQPAKVTLTVRKIDAIETDQTPVLGPPSEIFSDRLLTAGGHDYILGPAGLAAADFALPPGTYQLELRGVAQSDGSVDTAQTFVDSEYRTRDSLPVGHTIVQGVDLWDGHLTLNREDFRLPGRGAPLEFQRNYSSSGGDAIGPLGAAWSHNYESRVIIDPCGEVIVIGGEGGGMRFVSDGNGGLKPLRGFHGTLLINNSENGFDFYSKNGTRYHYVHGVDEEFPLAWIQDPDGNTTTLEYDNSSGQPQLVAVHDAAGRTLAFTYDRRQFFTNKSGPVLVQVTGPDGLSLSFDYDVYGNLIRAAREGDSRVETYAYALPPVFGPVYRHQLTDVTNVLNGAVTHYDAAQGVIGLQGANASVPTIYVTKVREPEGGETTFSFDQAALSSRTAPVLTATVTDPRQKVTTYTLNQYGSPLTITDPLQHTAAMEWSPNDVLMTSRTDANGVVTRFTYDANGNQLTESVDVTDVDGTPHTYTTTTEYWPPATFTPPYIKERAKTHTDRNGTVTTSSY
ncbi:MAG TPA: DUF6531 domain-containing protein, partial [Thermoanaerobaculia bacterium]|nr:DUF6531 domain-containing protein [Thermoanaerobaculia bacterium]